MLDLQRDLEMFRAKFRIDELSLTERGGWMLSLRPGQLTLGSMVLSVTSGTQDLARLTPEEGAGLVAGLGLAEQLARKQLGAVRTNALCLMMQDPVLHFHIFPRYDALKQRHGQSWQDTDWPGPPTITPVETPEALLMVLRDELRDTAITC
ncbi:hypothetical protein [Tritonibacter scottomollicae]|uniref:Diadenosine tetraphosphate (Ap4A) HIT family hydrolase n=1 Tax=Tritonibacter scottomollicae TaxID=483013 RepID=A0A2T1A6A2_TRISK|nr:hypothetical protein [Tritonibacter scottomollicae]PRZ43858.1 diadenosine tetraphosphate (Ap4A) HIT family hydrolase [Tritonibacter scottomollicae]